MEFNILKYKKIIFMSILVIILLIYFFSYTNNLKCPDDMVFILGGKFVMEREGERWNDTSITVELNDYCMDKYEYPNEYGEKPRVWVNWYQAKELCEKEGKRLCTSAEWQKGCVGPENKKFSYGKEFDPTKCNTGKERTNNINQTEDIAPSGAYPECVSGYGVYDLMGNVAELVSDYWDERERDGVWRGPMFIGGGAELNKQVFIDDHWTFEGFSSDCLSLHNHGLGNGLDDDGFRCCKGAEQ